MKSDTPGKKVSILPPDVGPQTMREWGLFCCGITWLEGAKQTRKPSLDRHSFLFLLEGELEWRSVNESGRLTAGEFLVMPFGTDVTRTYLTDKALQVWLAFQDIPDLEHLKVKGVCSGKSRHLKKIFWLVDELISWTTEASYPEKETIGNALTGMLRTCFEMDLHALFNSSFIRDERFEKLIATVTAYPERKWTVNSLAELICLTPAGLHALCLRIENTPPLKIVTGIRMLKARQLLINSDLPIEAIAEKVGYKTPYAFSNAFKRETGVRPGTYRSGRRFDL